MTARIFNTRSGLTLLFLLNNAFKTNMLNADVSRIIIVFIKSSKIKKIE